MHMRIVRATLQPGQVDELAQRWEAFIGPRLQEHPGFRRAQFGGDRAGNRTAAVLLWDTAPDPADLEELVEAFRAQVADLVIGPPEIADFEVLVDVSP